MPDTESERYDTLTRIIKDLRYEICQNEIVHAWALLEADNFKHLEWFFNETKNLHLVRPDFYEDLDKAYRDGKKLLKLLIEDVQTEFPPTEDKEMPLKIT